MYPASLLHPSCLNPALIVDVRRAGLRGSLGRSSRIDAGAASTIFERPDGQNFAVAVQRDRDPELCRCACVRSLDVGYGRPFGVATCVNVDGAGIFD